jgi:drug/metabolite transporter (DMT)-like permease
MLSLAMAVRLEPHSRGPSTPCWRAAFVQSPRKQSLGSVQAAVLAAIAHTLFEVRVTPPTVPVMACVLLLGIGPVGGVFLLCDIGMKQGDPRLLGALAYGVPVASTVILGLACFAPLSLVTVIASILVTLGGWIASRTGGSRHAAS